MYYRFLRWAFARFYREFAWTYGVVAWLVSRGLWRRWTLASLPHLSGRILELGCGTGYVQLALAQQRPGAAVGLDASPFMLAHTRRRLRQAHVDTHLVQAVAQALPARSACFDTVLSTFPSEYIFHPDTLAEVRRVLAPSGRLIIADAAQFTTSGLYERLVDLAYRITFAASVQSAPSHIAYQSFVEQAGFSVELFQEPVGDSFVCLLVATKR